MTTAPTPPTADALAGALALIDAMKPRDESQEGAPRMTAVFAYVRAEIARLEANERYFERSKAGASDAEMAAIDAECEAAEQPVEDALAALCALATATGHATATAGEARPQHVCGAHGFQRGGPESMDDRCPACEARR